MIELHGQVTERLRRQSVIFLELENDGGYEVTAREAESAAPI